ncbi:MAG TPA: hypothetical protein VI757_04540, partial [Bacteroidia bacterium]|nr:hypothetical protein [Bacteroidia bacterium]
MMRYADNLFLLVRRIYLLLIFYSLCRFLFLIFNLDFFSSLSAKDILLSFIHGLRFDISAIIILNIPVIALHFLPVHSFYNRYYQRTVAWLFGLINIPALLFNCVDFAYFRFSFRRTTADIFSVIGMGDDFMKLLPSMIGDFWYVLLIFITLSFLLMKQYTRISTKHFLIYRFTPGSSFKRMTAHFIFLVLIIIG